jgi:hypothetical protein
MVKGGKNDLAHENIKKQGRAHNGTHHEVYTRKIKAFSQHFALLFPTEEALPHYFLSQKSGLIEGRFSIDFLFETSLSLFHIHG